MESDFLKKFALGLLSIAIAGVVAFPGNVGAVKADSYYEDFPTAAQIASMPDLYQVKNDIIYADYFNQIESLGDILDNFNGGITLAYDEMSIKGTNSVQIGLKNRLDAIAKKRKELAADLKYINDPVASKVLNNYLKAINRYTASNQYLAAFYKTRSEYNFNMYLKNKAEGFDLHAYSELEATKRYTFYIKRAFDALNDYGY